MSLSKLLFLDKILQCPSLYSSFHCLYTLSANVDVLFHVTKVVYILLVRLAAAKSYDPTMILLIGMWISLTKKPMKPIMANPIAVAMAIF